jgi:hypothetical protein
MDGCLDCFHFSSFCDFHVSPFGVSLVYFLCTWVVPLHFLMKFNYLLKEEEEEVIVFLMLVFFFFFFVKAFSSINAASLFS